MASNIGWIGVDLDGTLAEYQGWVGAAHVGSPVVPMCDRVRKWLSEGVCVKVFTARVGPGQPDEMVATARKAIEAFCLREFGQTLEVTCTKDYAMVELWDDRCVQIIPNTGMRADGKYAETGDYNARL